MVNEANQAFLDRLRIYDYLAVHADRTISSAFLDEVENAYALLTDMPQIGALRDYGSAEFKGVRNWPIHRFSNHVIIYREIQGEITVLRIVHRSRNLDDLFG
jgi:plasmid stabilization system protein ParE